MSPPPKGIHHLFEAQAACSPASVALVCDREQLTYGELDLRANQVAHALQALGVGPEVCVGLCAGRSLEMMVGLLGILKAGGAYVPLDPAYPRQRLALMLEETCVSVLLTQRAVEPALTAHRAQVLLLDGDRRLFEAQPATRPRCAAGPENLAYVLYTSGSTGTPKGALVQHGGLIDLALETGRRFELGPDSRVLQFATLCFDASAWEILMAWQSGGALHLVRGEALLPGQALIRLLDESAITHAMLPPSVLAALPEARLPALRVLISAGEPCPADLVARWGAGRRFFNAYGPTEASICATVFECPPSGSDRPPPIGRPFTGASVQVLNEDLQPVADGSPGELHIGGAGVARGYLRRPELTAERFVPDPRTGQRLYRTGDLGRYLPDRNIELLGRVDRQTKIRGQRVEPGEVEATLARHPAVRQVAVVSREDVPGDRRLVAYVVTRAGQSPGPSEWRRFAQEVLPEFMVPAAFVELPALPLTPAGKVDRRALPAPGTERPRLATPYHPSVTPLQRALEAVLSQALSVAPVGLDDDFFELGGDSLRAASITARLRDVIELDLPAHMMLEVRTLARLAEHIEAAPARLPAPFPLLPRTGGEAPPLSFAQQRLWLLHQLAPSSAAYVIPAILRLSGPLDVAALESALAELVRRHEALRTTFPLEGDRPVQRISPAAPLPLPLVELEPAPGADVETKLAELARIELSRPFDLARGPLVRASLVRLGGAEHALLMALHHAICDGASMAVLVRELAALYEASLAKAPSPLPPLPVQYADYAAWQRRALTGPALAEGIAWWAGELEGAPHGLDLPADRPRPASPTFRGARRELHLSDAASRAVRALAREEGATTFMVLLAAAGALLHRCTGSEDILLGTPVAGRDRSALEGLIGFFANTVVLRVRLEGDPTFRDLLSRVRERALAAFAHQDTPFDEVVRALRPERGPSHQPLFQVAFAHQTPPPEAVTGTGLRWRFHEADNGAAPFDLTWNVWEAGGRVEGTVVFGTDLFEPATADRLVSDFLALVDEVTQAPERRLSRLERPSRWGWPEGAGPAEVEAALLADPQVEDCAVRFRRSWGSGLLRVAYVVAPAALAEARASALPPNLAPDLVVPVHAIPLTPAGRVDEESLRRLEALDGEVVRRCEAKLRERPGMAEVAVGVLPCRPSPRLLHRSDLLHDSPSSSPVAAAPRPELPAPASPGAAAAMAFSDGGPLVIPEGAPRTLVEGLLRAAAAPGGRGITYVRQDGSTRRQTYGELLDEARRVLSGLRAQGLGAGDRIILHAGSQEGHCVALWGCLLGGLVPVAVAVPPAYEARNAVVQKLHGAWELLGHPPVVTDAHLVEPLREALRMDDLRALPLEELRSHPPAQELHPARSEDVAFLQLSSGSTGVPKCIQETHAAIVCHVHGALAVNGTAPDDVALNWLSLDHVVPVVMFHLRDIYLGQSQVQVDTRYILEDPLRWLDLIEAHRVTHSWSPNFGYKLVCEALRRHPGRAWKLGSLKSLINGGEQVTVPVALEFLDRVVPCGAPPGVMRPAYGMAETGTAITWHAGFDPRHGTIEVARPDAPALSFVDVGPPAPGVELRIVDAADRLMPEGAVGRLQVRGGVVTPGYLHNEPANREAFVGDGWFNTGDLGVLRGGRLAITGREKELIIVRGAHFYCHELETVVNEVPGVEPSFAAACAVEDAGAGTEGLAIFFVPRPTHFESRAQIATAIRGRIAAAFGISPSHVIPLARDDFPRTTSGKIQRAALRKALAAGRFAAIIRELDLLEGNAATLPDWFYRVRWRPREEVTLAPAAEGGCLLFVDELGLGVRLSEELRRAGRRCVTVEIGATFARLGPDAFRLCPGDPDGYLRLLAELAGERLSLAQVLHLWTFDGRATTDIGGPARERGALGLLRLVQALARTGGERSIRLQVVSSHAQPTALDEAVASDKGLLLGLVQTASQELAWLDARHLDLPVASPAENAALVLRELAVARREREVACRGGRRLVPRLERVDLTSLEPRPLPFAAGGTYLVTGGLGGVGVALSRQLLQQFQARLLLVGRTPRTQALRALLEHAERHGGRVDYEEVDVGDAQALSSAVARAEALWGRPLDGVLHLAGVLEERLLVDETPEHLAAVLRPKVEGTLAVERLLADRPRAFCIDFSSVNGTFGGFAAGAYSASNRFLEHLAHGRRLCLAWSRWERLGPPRVEAAERLAEARGYQAIPAGKGWTSLLAASSREAGTLLVGLDGSNPHVLARLEGAPLRARELTGFFVPGEGAPPADEELPVDVRDRLGAAISSCRVRRVERLLRTAAGDVDIAAMATRGPARAGGPGERIPPANDAERAIAAIWEEVLGGLKVGVLDNFFELGGHSMLLAQVRGRLERAFGREIPPLELFRYPTVRALAAYLSGAAPARPGAMDVQERARKQRAAMGRSMKKRDG